MLMRLVIARDLDLHSASEDDHDPEIIHEDDQSDEDGQQELESPVVLKTMVGFVRNAESGKNSPVMPANDSATGNHARCRLGW